MADTNRLYPDIEAVDLKFEESPNSNSECVSRVSTVHDDELKGFQQQMEVENSPSLINVNNGFASLIDYSSTQQINHPECFSYDNKNSENRKSNKYFFYDTPFNEDTGAWIPISTPPMSASDHDEFSRGFLTNGAYFPDGDISWFQLAGEDRVMTMWDVFSEILLAARGKVTSFSMNELRSCKMPGIPTELLEQAWNEMAHSLSEARFGNAKEILDTEPPRWLADSAAACCMLCNTKFHPIICSRHHCRFCGGLFCSECSKGRCLLPSKFRILDPKRVCDVCFVRLEFVQPYLMDRVSRAAQLPTHDLTDLSTLRSWLNFPWGQSMESEIYKAANTVQDYCTKIGSLKPEKSIPDAILRQAKGLAILTVAKVWMMITYNVGTGLIIARHDDGSWSPPSAISTLGIGWGAQAGGELTDFIIVLRTKAAVHNFCGNYHISFGAGISAAAGIVGRVAEAELHAGAGGFAACYTYSRSKGAFLGFSLEGSMLTTRTSENCRFYGSPSMSASEILLGTLPRPPAAAVLYNALSDLFQRLEN